MSEVMLDVNLSHNGKRWRADLSRAIDLAIPLDFADGQPSFFGAPPAERRDLGIEGFSGNVASGASCNVGRYSLTPHCNGTHTECLGHLAGNAAAVAATLVGGLLPARLISVKPDGECITARQLAQAWPEDGFPTRALIVRSLPNTPDKRQREYRFDAPPPYFTTEALEWVITQGIEHLLTDLPSLDCMDDPHLSAHRVFWGLPEGHDATTAARPGNTITEMIYVPDTVADGNYLLDLQLPAFLTDAAPSRPLIYPLAIDSLESE